MWKSKSTPGFIIMVSLITLVGITIGSIFPVGPIQAQPTPIFPQGNDVQSQPTDTSDFQSQPTGTSDFQSQPTGTSDFQSQPTGTSDIASQNIDPEDLYFNMNGDMSSFITTPTSEFVVRGNWTLKAEGGNLSDFNADMIWSPTNVTAPNLRSHAHSFSNFIPDPTNEKIALMDPDNTLGKNQTVSINGVMDVGAGTEKTKWPGVPAIIRLAGNTITISLDDTKTGGHFNGYPVFGEIEQTEPCNGPIVQQFGANMEVIDIPTCPS